MGQRLDRPAQHSHVIAVAARNDHDIRRFAERKLGHSLIEILGDYLFGVREAFAIGVTLAIINDRHVKAGGPRCLVKTMSDVACAENVKLCWR